MTNNVTKIAAKEVEGIEPNEMYVGTIEFRSIGNNMQVQPFFRFSHNFPDDYKGEYPAAYLAVRDIGMMLSNEAQTIYNTELDSLPDDPDERALVTLSMAQKENESVQ